MSSTTSNIQAMAAAANHLTISQLPPELLVEILGKLKPHELLPSRAVSHRWCDSVHVVFGQVNTLILVGHVNELYFESYFDERFSRRAVGVVQLVVPKLSNYSAYFDLLGRLFPRVSQLMVGVMLSYTTMVKMYHCAINRHWTGQLKAFSVSMYMLDVESLDWFNETLLGSMISSGLTQLELKGIPSHGWTPGPELFLELEQFNLFYSKSENRQNIHNRNVDLVPINNSIPNIGPKCRRLELHFNEIDTFLDWCDAQQVEALASITRLRMDLTSCDKLQARFDSLSVLKLTLIWLNEDSVAMLAELPSLTEFWVSIITCFYSYLKDLDPGLIRFVPTVRDLHLESLVFFAYKDPNGKPSRMITRSPIGPSNKSGPMSLEVNLVRILFVPFFPRLRRLVCHDRVAQQKPSDKTVVEQALLRDPSLVYPRVVTSTFDEAMSAELERQLAICYPAPHPVLVHEALSADDY